MAASDEPPRRTEKPLAGILCAAAELVDPFT
jgi:hypothetical protein